MSFQISLVNEVLYAFTILAIFQLLTEYIG